LLSAAIGFGCGVALTYFLAINWVFRVRRFCNKGSEFAFFLFIGIAGLAVNEYIIWNATEAFDLHYQASKLVSAGAVFLFNFTLRKMLLFSRLDLPAGASN
ncbi:MAG: GtrA family protein, partial [Candidatus Binatia bacterium]